MSITLLKTKQQQKKEFVIAMYFLLITCNENIKLTLKQFLGKLYIDKLSVFSCFSIV